MGIETFKSTTPNSESLSDMKIDIKKENVEKVGLVLDELKSSEIDKPQKREIMKDLIGKTQNFSKLLAEYLASMISGKEKGEAEFYLESFKAEMNLKQEILGKSSMKDLSADGKSILLFGLFGEGLVGRVKEGNIDLATISEADLDKASEDIIVKMTDAFVKINESLPQETK